MIAPRHIVATGTLIKNERELYLLVKTEQRGWELPGGQVEEGENIIDALQREVQEESGIDISILKHCAIYSNISEPCKVILDFASLYKSGTIRADLKEILEVGWFKKHELLEKVENEISRYRISWLLQDSENLRIASYSKNPFDILSEIYLK
jgi:8-oxo-dGTP diphosphatase